MPKYVYRRPRGYRSRKPRTPSTESSVEISPGIGLPRIRISIPPLYSWCIILVWSSSNQLGTILTVKHLEVQLQDLPTYYGLNSDQNIVGHGTLAGGWICVYVPEGTASTNPSRTMVLVRTTIRSMNRISSF